MDDSVKTISTDLGNVADDTYTYIYSIISNPTVILISVVAVIAYTVMFAFLGNSTSSNNIGFQTNTGSSSETSYSFIVWIFVILIAGYGIYYFFGINIISKLETLLLGNPIPIEPKLPEAPINPVRPLSLRKQVFNIPENTFTYSDANALCKAYGARLATYKEVEDTYESGGEWCNYGWSEGQMALFPTQQSTFDSLQKIEGHENDCGRPGVNGGHMSNPELKFGVNCYGYKPSMTPVEEDIMATKPIYPKTQKDQEMEKRVNYWKTKLSSLLVSPFNHSSWSRL